MKTHRFAAIVLLGLVLTGCGAVLGQIMGATTGVKDFRVVQGDVREFGAVKTVLVFAPFEKAEGAWAICRGEDEALLAQGLAKEGMYQAEYYLERDLDAPAATLKTLQSETPERIRESLKLKAAPEAILSGVLLARDETVAPTVGVIQDLRLRLDLRTLATGKTSSVEIAVRALHRDLLPMIAKELHRRAAAGA